MTSLVDRTSGAPQRLWMPAAWLTLVATLTPGLAQAYVGPGLGLGAIASFFALVGAVLLGIVGFLWYPIKRLIKGSRRRKDEEA